MSIRLPRSLLIAFLVGIGLVMAACWPVTVRAQEVTVTTTRYSCEAHPDNAMYTTPGSCEQTAYGVDPHTIGAACPYEWRGWWIWVQGEGVFLCDDTSSKSGGPWLGYPHVDIRGDSYLEAYWFGIQWRQAKRVFYSHVTPLQWSGKEGRGPW